MPKAEVENEVVKVPSVGLKDGAAFPDPLDDDEGRVEHRDPEDEKRQKGAVEAVFPLSEEEHRDAGGEPQELAPRVPEKHHGRIRVVAQEPDGGAHHAHADGQGLQVSVEEGEKGDTGEGEQANPPSQPVEPICEVDDVDGCHEKDDVQRVAEHSQGHGHPGPYCDRDVRVDVADEYRDGRGEALTEELPLPVNVLHVVEDAKDKEAQCSEANSQESGISLEEEPEGDHGPDEHGDAAGPRYGAAVDLPGVGPVHDSKPQPDPHEKGDKECRQKNGKEE